MKDPYAPKYRIPATVRRVALAHQIPLGRSCEDGHYYIVDRATGQYAEMTRTANPKVCHALAMIRRYLADQ